MQKRKYKSNRRKILQLDPVAAADKIDGQLCRSLHQKENYSRLVNYCTK